MENICKKVSFAEAKEIIDHEADCMILDVREEEEYVTGHAEGAVLFPVDEINEDSAGEVIPSKDTPLLVYCRSGKRSDMAVCTLCRLGYRRIYNIGSLVEWPYGLEY